MYLAGKPHEFGDKYNVDEHSKLTQSHLIIHYCSDEILSIGIKKLIKNYNEQSIKSFAVTRSYDYAVHVFQILYGFAPESTLALKDLIYDIKKVVNS